MTTAVRSGVQIPAQLTNEHEAGDKKMLFDSYFACGGVQCMYQLKTACSIAVIVPSDLDAQFWFMWVLRKRLSINVRRCPNVLGKTVPRTMVKESALSKIHSPNTCHRLFGRVKRLIWHSARGNESTDRNSWPGLISNCLLRQWVLFGSSLEWRCVGQKGKQIERM